MIIQDITERSEKEMGFLNEIIEKYPQLAPEDIESIFDYIKGDQA